MNPRGRCKKCAAPVTWLRTSAGKWMPVDDASGRVKPSDVFSSERHAAHGLSCPEAKAFRKQQQQQQHAALDEANAKKAVIAEIGKIARELSNVYGIRRDQLQGPAKATVGVSSFEHLYAVPVTWLEERLFYALELYAEWFATDATEWDADMPQVLACTQAHFARCCQKRHKALGLKEPGRVEHATESV